jgi:hypothetical protein
MARGRVLGSGSALDADALGMADGAAVVELLVAALALEVPCPT